MEISKYKYGYGQWLLYVILLAMLTGCYDEHHIGKVVKLSVAEDNSAPTSKLSGYSDTVIPEGSKIKLQALAVFDDGGVADVSDTVTWTSSHPEIATVDSQGWVTAQKDLPSDSVRFTDITIEKQEVTAVHRVNVSSAVIESIQLSPHNIELNKGHSTAVTATGTYTDGSTRILGSEDNLLWKSSDPDTAPVDMYGVITAKEMGEAQISVSSGNLVGDNSARVSVLDITLESMRITPDSIVMPQATSQQLTVLGEYSDGIEREIPESTVNWDSSDYDTVEVTPYGEVRALKEGQANVYAKFESFEASSEITVANASIKEIQITSDTATLPVGFKTQFQAIALYDNDETHDVTTNVTWASSDELVAQIDSSGSLTANGNGLTTITAESSNGVLSNNVPISVNSAQLTEINLTPLDIQLPIDYQASIKAEGVFSDGQSFDVSSLVAWNSSTPGIVTIDHGVITGIAKGETKISAQLDGVSSTVESSITIFDAVLEHILLNNGEITINKGMSAQLKALGMYSDDSVLDLTNQVNWVSDNDSIVTIDTTGLALGVSEGDAQIDASLNGVTSAIPNKVTVSPALLTDIEIVSDSGANSIAAGYTLTYSANGLFSDGTNAPLTDSDVHWQSSNTDVASVSLDGEVNAVKQGVTTLTAVHGDITSNSVEIEVTEAELTSISVTAEETSIPLGLTTQVVAKGEFSDGSVVENLTGVTWSASGGVSVDQTGKVTAVTQNTGTVEAKKEGISGTTNITVQSKSVVGVEINPFSFDGDPNNNYFVPHYMPVVQLTADYIYSDGSRATISTSHVAWYYDSPSYFSTTVNGQFRSRETGTSTRATNLRAIAWQNNLTSDAVRITSGPIKPDGSRGSDSLCGSLGDAYDAIPSSSCISVLPSDLDAVNSAIVMAPLSRQMMSQHGLFANDYKSGAMPDGNDAAVYNVNSLMHPVLNLCRRMNEIKLFGLDSWSISNDIVATDGTPGYHQPAYNSDSLFENGRLEGKWPTTSYINAPNNGMFSDSYVSRAVNNNPPAGYIARFLDGTSSSLSNYSSNKGYLGCAAAPWQ